LNSAAVQGLVRQLAPRVLLDGVTADDGATNAPLVSAKSLFDRNFGYVRIGRFGDGLAARFNEAIEQLASSNKLKGLVIDLRYASGRDYASAVSTADGFFANEQPLLDWGAGVKKSSATDAPLSMPVAILINRETRGAAEAFAGILRQGRVALLLGTNTAGEACLYRDFSLSNGRRVRVAVSTVRLGNNEALPATGLKPDLVIEVDPQAERMHFADAYAVHPAGTAELIATNLAAASGTNRPPRRRINEAELVRAQREGREPGDETNRIAHPEPPRPTVTDPALSRALDLLKGLALVQQFRGR
jgi:C-terminal processing protease CtpA/Prc